MIVWADSATSIAALQYVHALPEGREHLARGLLFLRPLLGNLVQLVVIGTGAIGWHSDLLYQHFYQKTVPDHKGLVPESSGICSRLGREVLGDRCGIVVPYA